MGGRRSHGPAPYGLHCRGSSPPLPVHASEGSVTQMMVGGVKLYEREADRPCIHFTVGKHIFWRNDDG